MIARTEGNPFFLEESVRTLVETGLLVGAPGAYRLAQPLDTFQCPRPCRRSAARIDRLPPKKRLLQTAAVIGTEVPMPLLQAIAELPEAAFHHGLAHLQAVVSLRDAPLPGTGLHLQARPDMRWPMGVLRRGGVCCMPVEALEALAETA